MSIAVVTGQVVDSTASVAGTTPPELRPRWPQFPAYILNHYNRFSSRYDGVSSGFRKRMSHNLRACA